ncbi:hypothetical protein [Paenibacillus melissococcoides]|uniref:hypothetical protein n=1 Tax=Paenibacillus melissococcoides TaxID=2912268 RepID=UPI0021C400FA|nr:hypothetical protein [Paenibacillus melissococcoides]CAH8719731.1 hypothetical protein HTL2_005704 [Paenibacillus melissococcoides]
MPGLKHVALAAQELVHAPDTGGAPGATSGAAPASETPLPVQVEPDAAEAERARTTEIMDLCRTFSVEPDEYNPERRRGIRRKRCNS